MKLGKYQLVRKLATGGMAEVFLAKAEGPMGFEKTLVVKRILPHLAEDPHFVEMFLDEAKLAAQLNHPNIVQIFDFGEAEGAYFLAMEYVDGPNLRALARARPRAGPAAAAPRSARRSSPPRARGSPTRTTSRTPTTGEPLQLVHRDISPETSSSSRQRRGEGGGLRHRQGRRPDATRRKTGVIKGKLAYMAPEQLRASPSTRAPTSSRSAWCSTSCSPAASRSTPRTK